MQKICTSCRNAKPHSDFPVRAASKDGLGPRCKACKNVDAWIKYKIDPEERRQASQRAARARRARFAADPAYQRAFNLWDTTKRRTKIPPWVCITDFVPICRAAIDAGEGYELDHVIPLRHPLVCGLHVPANLRVVTSAENQAAYAQARKLTEWA